MSIRPVFFQATQPKRPDRRMEIIAHRGLGEFGPDGKRQVPENTHVAIREAARAGFSVELDIHATLDGELVVHHDFKTGRIFSLPSGERDISALKASELRSARLIREPEKTGFSSLWAKVHGHHYNGHDPEDYAEAGIPKLKDVLEAFPDTRFYVELKAPSRTRSGNNNLEERFADFVKENNLHDRVTAISFSHESLRRIKKQDPNIETGFITIRTWVFSKLLKPVLPLYLEKFVKKRAAADILMIPNRQVTPRLVQECKKAGLKLIPGTWRDSFDQEVAAAQRLETLGTDGFVMNVPDRLVQRD